MYIPAPFREDRVEVMHALMRQYSFASIVSNANSGLVVSHIPLLLDSDRGPYGTIVGHLARANPHGAELGTGRETLAIFQGPHAYISPTWYQTPYAVPTWNYVAVHAYGSPRLVDDEERLYDIVAKTVQVYEEQFSYTWNLEDYRDYAEKLLRNIVGFEFEITRLEGKRKLSQNRSMADREGVVAGLKGLGDPIGVALADMMIERSTSRPES